jgi:hypothetical protein
MWALFGVDVGVLLGGGQDLLLDPLAAVTAHQLAIGGVGEGVGDDVANDRLARSGLGCQSGCASSRPLGTAGGATQATAPAAHVATSALHTSGRPRSSPSTAVHP